MTNFDIKKFDSLTDISEMKDWFASRGRECPDLNLLPPNGMVVQYNGRNIAMGFLFKTDANFAVIGNLVSNPKEEKELRQKAVDQILEDLSKIAELFGFKAVTIATNIESLGQRFEKRNFIKTDSKITHYRRELCL
jgi:hypothetical protein